MRPILAGLETEYGLLVSGRGAAEQIDDSAALVKAYPGDCLPVWDYRYESPRADLRGFKQANLTFDPEDAKFDEGRARGPDYEIRSDRILPNGARFYNDHGHPEYSTPECFSLRELALHDKAGELAVLDAVKAYATRGEGVDVTIYKNNTDFHGASYGTHESYLVPRSVGFEALYAALMPLLVTRQILTGAGKVGAESGSKCRFQLSQRADFFSELANVDTLFRRPIFNTRDEPHTDPSKWIRLHVICGDANMMPSCTARKVGLVELALLLLERGEVPHWRLANPVQSFQSISRDEKLEFHVALEGQNWTTAYDVLQSYLDAADATLALNPEFCALIAECGELLTQIRSQDFSRFSRGIDWAAKKVMLDSIIESENLSWDDPALASYDLEYTNIDPDAGLYSALVEMNSIDDPLRVNEEELRARLARHTEPTRAFARGLAVSQFKDRVTTAAWRSVTFNDGDDLLELELPPDMEYPEHLDQATDVESFIEAIRQCR